PDRNVRKSTVGPLMVPLRPPAHSIWATFLPPRSAAWASVSAAGFWTPAGGANADTLVAKSRPLTWKVLLVDPCTAGQAPVVSVCQPAPVLGGAWVSRPSPDAFAPWRSRSRKPG